MSLPGVVTNHLDSNITLIGFELQSRYYIQSRINIFGKVIKLVTSRRRVKKSEFFTWMVFTLFAFLVFYGM